jgi:hypothetical protein
MCLGNFFCAKNVSPSTRSVGEMLRLTDRRLSTGDDPSVSVQTNRSSSSSISDNYDLLASYDNAIKSFCPNILLNDIHSNGVEVRSSYFTGVCMLADISGFTKLSNELGKDGSNGLDKLRKATSGFLSKFIYLVYSYGGDGMLSLSSPLLLTLVLALFLSSHILCW